MNWDLELETQSLGSRNKDLEPGSADLKPGIQSASEKPDLGIKSRISHLISRTWKQEPKELEP